MEKLKPAKIISIIIGVILSIAIIILAFKILQNVLTRAEDLAPREVVVSEITQNSAKISWFTNQDTQGVIEYGTSPTALNFFAPEAAKTKNHLVDLTLLSPATTYYLQIRIGDKKFDNGGVPWTFTTKGVERTRPSTPTLMPATPTPISKITIPDQCNETDCQKIKEKLGKGCSTQDYFKCIRKLTPTTGTDFTPTPTSTLTPTP